MENGGLVAVGAYRKHVKKNCTQRKYPTIVKLTAEIEAEEAAAAEIARLEAEEEEMEEAVPEPEPISIDQLTEQMDKKMKIAKKSKSAKIDVEMEQTPKISIKSRGIKRCVKKASRHMRSWTLFLFLYRIN